MIYQISNPEIAENDRLVYLPDCKSATKLHRYQLERKQMTVPNWLPSQPRDINGLFACIVLIGLASLSISLLASLLGVSDNRLPIVALATAAAILCLQFTIEWYREWAAQFNRTLETSLLLGIPVKESIALQVLRQQDPEVFDEAVEVMSTNYGGTYNLSHRFSEAIDEYVECVTPTIKRDYYDNVSNSTPAYKKQILYNHLLFNLQPIVEKYSRLLKHDLVFYDTERQYM